MKYTNPKGGSKERSSKLKEKYIILSQFSSTKYILNYLSISYMIFNKDTCFYVMKRLFTNLISHLIPINHNYLCSKWKNPTHVIDSTQCSSLFMQLQPNDACLLLLLHILSTTNSDWLQHVHSVCKVYELK